MVQDTIRHSQEEEVRRTIAEFCHCADAGDYDGWTKLFTEDGAFRLLGNTYVGHLALRAFIEEDQPPERRGLHLTTDSVIRLTGDIAEVRSNFIFVTSGSNGAGVAAAGRYLDILVPRGSRWLFRERETELMHPKLA